jgi:hypothetical protein
MAPQNRIWGLNDIGNPGNLASHPSGSNGDGNGNGNGSNNSAKENNPLAASYCQPASASAASTKDNNNNTNNNNIKLCHIPNLSLNDVCASTLKRVLEEFHPIIARRGYNVLSVSELCCCGDGMDYEPRRRRKLRKQSNNVWGYNMTRFLSRGKTTHSIHLRLRDPRGHERLLGWEDVAGTMAHELSHCVHQNHSPAFYKLMEEILEEHATVQAKKAGMNFEPLNGNSVIRQDNPASTGVTTTTTSMPTSEGHRLGGASKGKSRLLDGEQQGHRLGGSKTPASLRGAMARAALERAAETRGRLLEQTRRMMERAKEPCVIEILDDEDDDDDDENDDKNGYETGVRENIDQKPKAKRKGDPSRRAQNIPTSGRADEKKQKSEIIDLTATIGATTPISPTTESDEGVAVNPVATWACSRCTFRNRPLSLVCDMCLSERT